MQNFYSISNDIYDVTDFVLSIELMKRRYHKCMFFLFGMTMTPSKTHVLDW